MKSFKLVSALLAVLVIISMATTSYSVPITDKTGKNFQTINPKDGSALVDPNGNPQATFVGCSTSTTYAVSGAVGGAQTPVQALTFSHNVTSSKQVYLYKIYGDVEANTNAANLLFQVTYMTGPTMPVAGTIINAMPLNSTDGYPDTNMVAFPGNSTTDSMATSSPVAAFGMTAGTFASTVSQPAPFVLYAKDPVSFRKPLAINKFTAEGWAVTARTTATTNITTTFCGEFTEQ